MTCVIGLIDRDAIWMGADSAGVGSNYSLMLRADKKVFHNGPFLMGFTSSFRMGQLLRYSFQPPEQPLSMDESRYMHTLFINAVRQCLKDGGWASKDKESEFGGNFLVGYRGRIYEVESDYQIAQHTDPFAAVGCGCDVALGSMFSTAGMPPKKRMLQALAASERYSAGVRGPFVVLKSKES